MIFVPHVSCNVRAGGGHHMLAGTFQQLCVRLPFSNLTDIKLQVR